MNADNPELVKLTLGQGKDSKFKVYAEDPAAMKLTNTSRLMPVVSDAAIWIGGTRMESLEFFNGYERTVHRGEKFVDDEVKEYVIEIKSVTRDTRSCSVVVVGGAKRAIPMRFNAGFWGDIIEAFGKSCHLKCKLECVVFYKVGSKENESFTLLQILEVQPTITASFDFDIHSGKVASGMKTEESIDTSSSLPQLQN